MTIPRNTATAARLLTAVLTLAGQPACEVVVVETDAGPLDGGVGPTGFVAVGFGDANDANDNARQYTSSSGSFVCQTWDGLPIEFFNRWDFAGGTSCGVCHCTGLDTVECSTGGCPPPRPPDSDAGSGLNCDPWTVTCATEPIVCPVGQVNELVNGCWGPCVSVSQCNSLPCNESYPSCPPGTECESRNGVEICYPLPSDICQ